MPSLTYTADIPEIERVLFAYFNAPFQERWKYTTAGEALKDRMKEYYGEAMPVRCDKVTVVRQMPVGGRHHKVEARVRGSGDVQGTGIWFVRIEDRSVLIDWPASVGLWSMPVKTCLALGSDQAVLARVTAVLDDYYNYTFSGKEDIVQSVRLEAQNNTVHGYVKRHSPVCDQLIGILKDGNEHQITVLFRQVGNQLDHVLIVALVSRTWILEPPDEVTARRELSG